MLSIETRIDLSTLTVDDVTGWLKGGGCAGRSPSDDYDQRQTVADQGVGGSHARVVAWGGLSGSSYRGGIGKYRVKPPQ